MEYLLFIFLLASRTADTDEEIKNISILKDETPDFLLRTVPMTGETADGNDFFKFIDIKYNTSLPPQPTARKIHDLDKNIDDISILKGTIPITPLTAKNNMKDISDKKNTSEIPLPPPRTRNTNNVNMINKFLDNEKQPSFNPKKTSIPSSSNSQNEQIKSKTDGNDAFETSGNITDPNAGIFQNSHKTVDKDFPSLENQLTYAKILKSSVSEKIEGLEETTSPTKSLDESKIPETNKDNDDFSLFDFISDDDDDIFRNKSEGKDNEKIISDDKETSAKENQQNENIFGASFMDSTDIQYISAELIDNEWEHEDETSLKNKETISTEEKWTSDIIVQEPEVSEEKEREMPEIITLEQENNLNEFDEINTSPPSKRKLSDPIETEISETELKRQKSRKILDKTVPIIITTEKDKTESEKASIVNPQEREGKETPVPKQDESEATPITNPQEQADVNEDSAESSKGEKEKSEEKNTGVNATEETESIPVKTDEIKDEKKTDGVFSALFTNIKENPLSWAFGGCIGIILSGITLYSSYLYFGS